MQLYMQYFQIGQVINYVSIAPHLYVCMWLSYCPPPYTGCVM